MYFLIDTHTKYIEGIMSVIYKSHGAPGKVDKFQPALKITIHCPHPNLTLFNVILLNNHTTTKPPEQILLHFNILPTCKSGRVKQSRGKNVT